MIPAIGMGTSGSFQVPSGGAEYEALKEVLKRFFAGGATLIDTAPTYGNAEDNLGPLLAEARISRKRSSRRNSPASRGAKRDSNSSTTLCGG
jgi:aryl-alcohol dehydrogenase-like predicted oxidoreductase